MIEVRDLVKRYSSHLAVDHLSFSVPDGQIFGFLGPNGAGKSTTMNIMTGYLGATEGEVLVDGHSIINRAFYGVTNLTNSEGLHTNAIFGFLNTLFKVLDEEKPDYLTVAFDVKAPTFRHKLYDAYKGTRKPMPEELHEQVPVLKDVLHAMGIATMEKAGLEADDLLGTVAKRSEKKGMEVRVLSGDRDLLQLATYHIRVRLR